MRWLEQFSVLLLDMNGTFMFGHDRIGPNEDYFVTYQAVGGRNLLRRVVEQSIQATCDGLSEDYECPDRVDDFPSLAEALLKYGNAQQSELPFLERVLAEHEMGYVPAAHRAFLERVAKSHQLGLVSNLWAKPEPWRELFERTGLLALFEITVFSSEGRSIKPSRSLFERALVAFPSHAKVAFVGDSLERDIIPAKSLGLSTCWLAPPGSTHPAADLVVESLPELAEAPA
jgi:putative hydrolase of the HAD superfamily/5'-nucleotidase